MILVDSNVIIDVLTEDPSWQAWSEAALSDAADGDEVAINPIIYDQMSRFGLRQKRVLETIVAHPDGVDNASFGKILGFTKLFWANRGNHHEITAQKIMPDFTFEELRDAGLAALRHGLSHETRNNCTARASPLSTV